MHRRRAAAAAAAIFAIGAAFAAQPTSLRADWGVRLLLERPLWVPGSLRPMSARELNDSVLAPPH
jgi:hypothetical protein